MYYYHKYQNKRFAPKLPYIEKQPVKKNTKYWTWLFWHKDLLILFRKENGVLEITTYPDRLELIKETYHGKDHLRFKGTGKRFVIDSSDLQGCRIIF